MIIVSMDSSVFHIVKHVDAALKEQHLKFAINKMRPVSVKRMYKAKCATDVLMEPIIFKSPIQKVAPNVSVSARQHAVIVHICVHSMSA